MRSIVAFYGDLNCPFCFATNERLHALGVADKVEWRGLQHEPYLPIPARPTERSTRELAEEIERLRVRAPDIEIRVPSFRPNSGPATALVAALARDKPRLARALRRVTFRALWLESKDISQREVLEAALAEVGGRWPVWNSPASLMAQWQEEWEQGPFDRRIPALRTGSGGLHLGLQDPEALFALIESDRNSAATDDVCEPR
ncbi:MAG: DsbA family protein [Myxococcota bacterium]